MIFSLIFTLWLAPLTLPMNITEVSVPKSGNIIIHIHDIKDVTGEILAGLYDSQKTFRKVKRVYKYSTKPVEGIQEKMVIEDVHFGTYAIAVFQDVNGNNKFDSNLFGIPKESFGFSTNFIVKRRAPKFKEVEFTHNQGVTEMHIEMQTY